MDPTDGGIRELGCPHEVGIRGSEGRSVSPALSVCRAPPPALLGMVGLILLDIDQVSNPINQHEHL